MKLKKFFSFLIAPLLCLTVLFGCSNGDGTAKTCMMEYYNMMTSFSNEYKSADGETEIYNNIFKLYPSKTTPSTLIKAQTYIYPSFNHITKNKNDYEVNNKIENFVLNYNTSGEELLGAENVVLTQFSTVYQTLLSMIFNYYDNWQASFYSYATNVLEKNGKTDKDDFNNLFDKIENLGYVLEDFQIKKNKLQEELILFDVEGQIFEPTVAAFNREYNKVIEASLDFVKYFEQLHIKYNMPEFDVNNKEHFNRLYDSSILKLAEAVYYESVKGFEQVKVCDLTKIQTNSDSYKYYNISKIKTLLNYAYGSLQKNIVVKEPTTFNSIYENNLTDQGYKDLTEKQAKVVLQLQAINTIFSKEIEIYKICSNNLDFYKYTTLRSDQAKFDEWESSLSNLETINIKGLRDFENSKISQMINAVNAVLGYVNV